MKQKKMKKKNFALVAAISLLVIGIHSHAAENKGTTMYANQFDLALANQFDAREKDWRNGAVVYQVLVDRFVPSARLAEKKSLYPAPKVLRAWTDTPKRGTYLPDVKLWSHEIDFWGGDLASVSTKLDYIKSLGADVLYLNPIHLAYTNHKYDALDYEQISPEYGTRDELKKLTSSVHNMDMKIVLDGVFNHMGRNSKIFREAEANPKSPYRDWFEFGKQFSGGVRAWALAENLPELNLENQKVRDYLYATPDSVVRSYLRDGIDGWRLDVAYDIGFKYLGELTSAAHKQKPGSLVVGEIANYPKEWFPAVDAVMNFTLREIILQTAQGKINAETSIKMISRVIEEAGIENSLKSWTMLDNHDNFRLATVLPDQKQRKLAQVMQFTLPGSPNLYYGSELDMIGGDDPEMRAPMRWDLVNTNAASLNWTKQLISLHKKHRALRIGNFRTVTSDKLIAYERYTDRVQDSVIVLLNPTNAAITETVMVPNSKLMNGSLMLDVLSENLGEKINGKAKAIPILASIMSVTVPAGGYLLLSPATKPEGGYSPYKRVQ